MVLRALITPWYFASQATVVCTCTRVFATSSGEQRMVESTPAPMPETALAAVAAPPPLSAELAAPEEPAIDDLPPGVAPHGRPLQHRFR